MTNPSWLLKQWLLVHCTNQSLGWYSPVLVGMCDPSIETLIPELLLSSGLRRMCDPNIETLVPGLVLSSGLRRDVWSEHWNPYPWVVTLQWSSQGCVIRTLKPLSLGWYSPLDFHWNPCPDRHRWFSMYYFYRIPDLKLNKSAAYQRVYLGMTTSLPMVIAGKIVFCKQNTC